MSELGLVRDTTRRFVPGRWGTSCRWFLGACVLLLSQSPGVAGKVTFRDDHTVLVDGKPFFPIGLYYTSEEFEDQTGQKLKALKQLGFNTLGYYRDGAPTWQQELDRANRLGLKVWIRGTNGFAIDSPAIEKDAIAQVRRLRGSPALLFWEFQDEPILNKVSIDGSRKGYALVKREDPDHPMLVVEWPGAVERMQTWRGMGDIFGTDLYPIPRKRGYGKLANHDISQMRDYLQALKRAYGDKPRLLVLQAWAWEPLKDGEAGYPTPQENRFMAYQSVIHGANALFYYGQVHCSRPNSASALDGTSSDPSKRRAEFAKCVELNARFWREHRKFFKELSDARSLFVLRAMPAAERWQASGSIEHAGKADGAERYVLAVNPEPKRQRATFRLPASSKLPALHVLFEDRKVNVADSVFSDDFAPYDVHVYGTTAKLPPSID